MHFRPANAQVLRDDRWSRPRSRHSWSARACAARTGCWTAHTTRPKHRLVVPRRSKNAADWGLGFGAKLTNTLVVRNKREFFPPDISEAYLSGPPLHVLAIRLAARLREAVGTSLPISFSAGIDWSNFADVVALDFAPVTVCTDWLKPGGYGRASRYFDELYRRMETARASSRGDWVIRSRGHGRAALSSLRLDSDTEARCLQALDERKDLAAVAGDAYTIWVREAARLNTQSYADAVLTGGRYDRAHHDKPTKKLGTNCIFSIASRATNASLFVPTTQTSPWPSDTRNCPSSRRIKMDNRG